jgi:hypothetical protein
MPSSSLTGFVWPSPRQLLLCVGWGWQAHVYLLLPDSSLKLGYFLTPVGYSTSLTLLVAPVLTVATGLLVSLVAGLWLAWRSGQRWSLLPMMGWWLVAALVFLAPDVYLSLQGYGVDF